MTDRIRVAVLRGGPDAERAVSLDSGARVLAALEQEPRFTTSDHVIDRPEADELAAIEADVIFPVLHGPFGEGGTLQERIETSGRPYVGCGPTASRLAMDKIATKETCTAARIPTAPWARLVPGEAPPLDPPVVLKPVAEGSSVGVRICRLRRAGRGRPELESDHDDIMIERFVEGRELTVGIALGHVLPTIEIVVGGVTTTRRSTCGTTPGTSSNPNCRTASTRPADVTPSRRSRRSVAGTSRGWTSCWTTRGRGSSR